MIPSDIKWDSATERALNIRGSSGADYKSADIIFRYIYPKTLTTGIRVRDGVNPKCPDATAWIKDNCSDLIRIKFTDSFGVVRSIFAYPKWLDPYAINSNGIQYCITDAKTDQEFSVNLPDGSEIIGCRFYLCEYCAGRVSEVNRARAIYHQNGYSALNSMQVEYIQKCGCGLPENYQLPGIEEKESITPAIADIHMTMPSMSDGMSFLPSVTTGVTPSESAIEAQMIGYMPAGVAGYSDPEGDDSYLDVPNEVPIEGMEALGSEDHIKWYVLLLIVFFACGIYYYCRHRKTSSALLGLQKNSTRIKTSRGGAQ